jgi:alpha/beta superfamily hydrolase
MNGYFISSEKAQQLGLLNNPSIRSELQKTIIAVTDKDVLEYQDTFNLKRSELSEEEMEKYANWFYKNYFYSIMESIQAS